MASTKTVTFSCNAQTWVYPELTYNPYSGTDADNKSPRKKHHWYRNHSNKDKWDYCYQGGVSDNNGRYNGNMMSTMNFKSGSKTLKDWIAEIGGTDKITKVVLKMKNVSTYNGASTDTTFYFYVSKNISYVESSASSLSGLGLTSIGTKAIKRGETLSHDITSHKSKLSSSPYVVMYKNGAYDDKKYYGYFNKAVTLEVTYTPNTAPTAALSLSGSSSNGYYKPDSITLKGTASDVDGNLESKPFYYEIINSSNKSVMNSGWTSNKEHSFVLTSYRSNTMTAKVTVKDTEGETGTATKGFKVNSLPSFSSSSTISVSGATNGVFNGDVTLSWPKADEKDGQVVKYKVEVSRNGKMTTLASAQEGRTFTTGKSWTDGTECKFYVTPTDGLEFGNRIASSTYYVNQPPAKPMIYVTEGHYEASIPVSWSRTSGTNGSTIANYYLEVYKNNTLVETKSFSSTTVSTTYVINDNSKFFERGSSIKFRVRAKDNIGEYSAWSDYSEVVTRNYAPTNPGNFKVNKDILYCKGSVPLIWNRSTDKEGDKVTYDIEYKTSNTSSYQVLVSNLPTSGNATETYSHTFTNIASGVSITYRIKAKDALGATSSTIEIAAPAIVNTPPTSPTINYPVTGRNIYIRKPRIVFTTGKTVNGLPVTMFVKIGSQVYNSVSHADCFDKTSYGSGATGVFTCKEALNLSSVTIRVYSSDGMDASGEDSKTYVIENSMTKEAVAGERLAGAADLNNIRIMINMNLFAYGQRQITWAESLVSGTPIKASHYEEIRAASASLVSFINSKCNSSSSHRELYRTLIQKGNFMSAAAFNKILTMTIEP